MVDTNILLYAAYTLAPERPAAMAAIEEWKSGQEAWFVTWATVYEFPRVATHHTIFGRPLTLGEAWSLIENLRASPSFGMLTETDRHAEVVRELAREHPRVPGNLAHDLHIAALMREHGVTEFRTADTDFHQFKFLRVVNSL